MEKTLELLERNVQWFALGLGGLFLLWAAYAYVLTPPATVMIPGHGQVVAGDVAPLTNKGPVKQVNDAIHAPAGVFASRDVVTPWVNQMAAPLAVALLPSWSDSPLPPGTQLSPGPEDQNSGAVHVASLPQLPKAAMLPAEAGMSVVQLSAPANPDGSQPVAQPQVRDLLWVTIAGKIPADALSKAFSAPLKGQPVNPSLYNTTLLQVILQRQHSTGMDANGKPIFPSDDSSVEDLQPLLIYQGQMMPFPGNATPAGQKYAYVDWADKHADMIAQPAFYEVVGGTPWKAPELPIATPPSGPVTRPGIAPRGAFPARAGQPTGGAYVPPAAVRPGGNGYYAPGESFGRTPGFTGDIMPGGTGIGDINGTLAQGKLNALSLQKDIEIWGHDETVKPGQTYRYRIIYKMKNPIFGIQNMADPKLVDQFALVSPVSDWSEPVTVADNIRYWLAGVGRGKATVDVFQWLNGSWKVTRESLSPGDAVPGTDASLVDVRGTEGSHEKDKYALFTDPSGALLSRYLTTDRNDSGYQDLLNQTANPAPAPPAAAPDGGMPPEGFPPAVRPPGVGARNF